MTGADDQAGDSRVRAWLECREALERQLEPLGRAAMARLRPARGERVLDIGCGIGGTPAALARAVGPTGSVVGVDVLNAALDVLRADGDRPSNISFLHADAELHRFAPGGLDAAFSRFGVMFFADAVAAFSNVRRALRPGGRLAFVCWRGLAENELDQLPLRAAAAHLPAELVADAEGASHFTFDDPDRLRKTLGRAGYAQVQLHAHDEDVRTGDLRTTVEVCSRFGSLGVILRQRPELRSAAAAALERALRDRDGPDGPALRAATWIVLARAPA